ncbi:vancomycin high temperature exclusion protein [Actinoplanes sp. NPDC049599]|uniref:vancomycin high temperature exclusion protein n=1 Tax=Actinoplanes sp. NPDC049599 TaxID=3363903 RepID=UPI00378B2762
MVKVWFRRSVVSGALCLAAVVLAMAAGDLWVRAAAHGHVYAEAAVPAAPVALVLGAEVYPDGNPSPFLAARLEIARRLLAAGKVRAILVSGDHMDWGYNEPGAMFQWLVDRGVPSQRIVLDHAGFDTYDSCARARAVFGVSEAIVVTQSYHIDRAVALCRRLGVTATGVGDDTVRIYREPWRNSVIRERGAVVKALGDVLSGRDPVFLGPLEPGVEVALHG